MDQPKHDDRPHFDPDRFTLFRVLGDVRVKVEIFGLDGRRVRNLDVGPTAPLGTDSMRPSRSCPPGAVFGADKRRYR